MRNPIQVDLLGLRRRLKSAPTDDEALKERMLEFAKLSKGNVFQALYYYEE